jgi:hypothetical protein
MPAILVIPEAEIRRITDGGQPPANSWRDPISKIPNTKKVVAEWFKWYSACLEKCEALSSNPSTNKK